MNDTRSKTKSNSRRQTAQQKLNNFLRSPLANEYPLTAAKRLTLHALASFCYYNEECNPSIPRLCEYIQFSDTYIKKIIRNLELLGLIKITRNNGSRNKYKWLVPYISDEEIYKKKAVNKSAKTHKKRKSRQL